MCDCVVNMTIQLIPRETGEIITIHMDRLLLVEATAQVMEKCFDLLGIKTVSRM